MTPIGHFPIYAFVILFMRVFTWLYACASNCIWYYCDLILSNGWHYGSFHSDISGVRLASSIFTHLFLSIAYSSIIIIIINNSSIRMKCSLIWSEGSIFIYGTANWLTQTNDWKFFYKYLNNWNEFPGKAEKMRKKTHDIYLYFYMKSNKIKREWNEKDKRNFELKTTSIRKEQDEKFTKYHK